MKIEFMLLATRIGARDQRRMKDQKNGRSFLPLEQATGHSQSAAGEIKCEDLKCRRKSMDGKEIVFGTYDGFHDMRVEFTG